MMSSQFPFATVLVLFTSASALSQSHQFTLAARQQTQESSSNSAPPPVVELILENISSDPIPVARIGPFFDYACRLTDSSGKDVPLTEEGRAIRYGSRSGQSLHVSIATIHLQPGEAMTEVMDLRKYFAIPGPGTYQFRATRNGRTPKDSVSSNLLSIKVK